MTITFIHTPPARIACAFAALDGESGRMEREPRQHCGVMILPSTAKVTGGYCMPCAKGEVSGFEQNLEARRRPSDGVKLKPGEWLKAIFLGIPVLLGITLLLFLAKVAVAAGVVAIARWVFGAGWDTASFAGVIAYIVLSLLGGLPGGGNSKPSAKKRQSGGK